MQTVMFVPLILRSVNNVNQAAKVLVVTVSVLGNVLRIALLAALIVELA